MVLDFTPPFYRNGDGQREAEKDERGGRDPGIQFVWKERGFPKKTLEVRLSDSGDTGEGE